jgi:adenylosuccinate lyase
MEKNLNKTKGLIYSQRVMLAFIDKGLSAGRKQYKLVLRNAYESWERAAGRDFLKLFDADKDCRCRLTSPEELDPLFVYKYYLRYVDEIFKRLGLTENQWKKVDMALEPNTVRTESTMKQNRMFY